MSMSSTAGPCDSIQSCLSDGQARILPGEHIEIELRTACTDAKWCRPPYTSDKTTLVRTINWIRRTHEGDVVKEMDIDKQTVAYRTKRRCAFCVVATKLKLVVSGERPLDACTSAAGFKADVCRAKYRSSTPWRAWSIDTTCVVETPVNQPTERLLAAFDRLFKSGDPWSQCDRIEIEAEYKGTDPLTTDEVCRVAQFLQSNDSSRRY